MFFLTAINFREDTIKDDRCFGYYENQDKAVNAVKVNMGDMHECYYNYLVIEDIPWGIHASPNSELWFRWNTDDECWEESEKPEFAKQIVNWAIG